MAKPPSRPCGQTALLSTDLLAYYRRVSQSPLTVVDVETTGALAYKDRVIEVSVLQASLQEGIQSQQTSLINPGSRIPAMITRITGITQEMVAQAKWAEAVWPNYLHLLQSGVLTAHNLDFDYGFLRSEFKYLEVNYSRPPQQRFCTVLLSRLLLADLPSRSLPNLVAHFQFQVGASHRAEADTLACWLLAERLLTQIQNESDEQLLQRFGQQWVRLQDVAKLLKRPKAEVAEQLYAANADSRYAHSQKPLFRRRDIERLYWEYQGQQLTVLDS